MSRIEELIREMCPDGVEYFSLLTVANVLYGYPCDASLFNTKRDGKPLARIRDVLSGVSDTYTTENVPERYELAKGDLLVGMDGNFHVANWKTDGGILCQRVCKVYSVDAQNTITNGYLSHILGTIIKKIEEGKPSGTVKHLLDKDIKAIEIPVPPIEVQQEIVHVLDKFTELETELQAELDARKKQYEYYRDELLVFDKDVPEAVEYKSLADVYEYRRGSFPQPYTEASFYGGDNAMPFVQVADISDEGFKLNEITNQTISKKAQPKSVFVPQGTVIVSLQGTIGRVAITQYDTYVDRTVAIFTKPKIENLDSKFFAYVLKQKFDYAKQFARGSTIKTITKEEFSQFEIPIPPIEIQKEVVCILDKFTELRSNLQVELEMCHKQYEYYRDKLLTFKRKEV